MIKEFANLSSFTFQAAPAAKSTTIEKEEEKGNKPQKSSVRKVIQLDIQASKVPLKDDKKQKEIELKARQQFLQSGLNQRL
jgi:hypothetical protein